MNGSYIRVETLPPMRVAYFTAFGQHPEMKASGSTWFWADQSGFIIEPHSVHRFGFNTPLGTTQNLHMVK